jgi:hypothetical protein
LDKGDKNTAKIALGSPIKAKILLGLEELAELYRAGKGRDHFLTSTEGLTK